MWFMRKLEIKTGAKINTKISVMDVSVGKLC